MQERAAGKCNQPDAIAAQFVDQILRRELDPLQTIRRHIVREHATRSIDRDDKIEAFALDLLVHSFPSFSAVSGHRAAGALLVPGDELGPCLDRRPVRVLDHALTQRADRIRTHW